ncbi:MAG: TRM11 family SAM-dependent methyltransferase, partial [Thermoplasmata archaeon]
ARAMGSDLRSEVVEGCHDNLEAFGLVANLFSCDVGRVPSQVDEVDAVATDPPYGRAAATMGEDLPELMRRAFVTFHEVLRAGGRVAISLPHPDFLDLGKQYLRLLEWHSLPVHRSLVRYFAVFEKP